MSATQHVGNFNFDNDLNILSFKHRQMESGQCCVVSISMAKLESEQKVNFKSKKVISLTFRICIFHSIFWFIAVMLPYDSFSDIIVFEMY